MWGSTNLYGQTPPAGPKPGSGFDPGTLSSGYSQPLTADPYFGKKGAPLFLTTQAPQRLDTFRREAEPLIGEQFRGALLESLATITGQQRVGEQQQADQIAFAGIDPAYATGKMIPQQRQQFAEAAGGARGQAMAGEAGAQLDLRAMLLNAMNELEAFYDTQQMEWALAAKARSTARHGARSAERTTLLGAGLGAAGMALGGPGGYFSKG